MVKVEITDYEIQALDVVFQEARVSINVGAIIANFRNKIAAQFQKEQKKEAKKETKK